MMFPLSDRYFLIIRPGVAGPLVSIAMRMGDQAQPIAGMYWHPAGMWALKWGMKSDGSGFAHEHHYPPTFEGFGRCVNALARHCQDHRREIRDMLLWPKVDEVDAPMIDRGQFGDLLSRFQVDS